MNCHVPCMSEYQNVYVETNSSEHKYRSINLTASFLRLAIRVRLRQLPIVQESDPISIRVLVKKDIASTDVSMNTTRLTRFLVG